MDKYVILIAEDNNDINNLIAESLQSEGFETIQAYSGTEALMCLRFENVSMVLLDLMMPGMHGEEVLRKIKKSYEIPVMVVSAKDDLDTKLELLDSGADDYMTKPFEIKELIARIHVQLRNSSKSTNTELEDLEERVTYRGLSLDTDSFSVLLDGHDLGLTRQEYKIMELLMEHPSKVFSKQQIYEYAWDEYYIGEDKTINVHISNIRSKLKQYTEESYIDTVWGIGFKLN